MSRDATFFFFKPKTAYEMRISDWSSDVCSSDLPVTGAFRWTPALNASGSYSVVFTASDGNKSSSETVTITVANANQAPQFVPMGLQLVREGAPITFRVAAGAADGDPLQLSVRRRQAGSASGRGRVWQSWSL